MAVRRALVSQALGSFQGLRTVLNALTEEEVLECLRVESSSLRRESVIDRLISRAARLHELSYVAQLKEKFRGKSDDPR